MRHALKFVCLTLALGWLPTVAAQEVVDRVVARVQNDIITLSEVRELERYQQLVAGHAESDGRVITELVEQWVVNSEAKAARFPQPPASEMNGELERLERQFPSPQAFLARLRAVGLTEDALRRVVTRQIYLARYLDYKFRPSVQVDENAVEKYYHDELVPTLQAEGKGIPSLEAVRGKVRELLTQRAITDRTAKWLEEAKSRLKIEVESGDKGS